MQRSSGQARGGDPGRGGVEFRTMKFERERMKGEGK